MFKFYCSKCKSNFYSSYEKQTKCPNCRKKLKLVGLSEENIINKNKNEREKE